MKIARRLKFRHIRSTEMRLELLLRLRMQNELVAFPPFRLGPVKPHVFP